MNIVKKLLAFSIVICGAAVSASEWSYSSNAVSDGNWTLGGKTTVYDQGSAQVRQVNAVVDPGLR